MYKKNELKWTKHYDFVLLDILCLIVSFFAGCYLKNGSVKPVFNQYRSLLMVYVLIDLSVLFFNETYSDVLKRGYLKELKSTFIHAFNIALFVSLYMTLAKVAAVTSRIMFGLTLVVYAVLSYTVRCLRKKIIKVRARGATKKGKQSLFVLVDSAYVNEVTEEIHKSNYEGFYIAGLCILDKDREGETVNGFKVTANKANVLEYICHQWIDDVLIVAKNNNQYHELTVSIKEMGITQHIKINISEELADNTNIIEDLGPYLCITSAIKTATIGQLFIKRSADIFIGIVGSLVTIVLCILFWPIVQIKSPGPLIYVSERIGKNGKRFKFYKFRSMIMNAESMKKDLMDRNRVADGMMFKIENDPRIIAGYGTFIRKTSLDEFPQFFNVLKGDMSFVGTRPPTPDEWEKYKLHHRARLSIKPGITGMWQTSGRSTVTDFEEVVKLDSIYIRNWSLGLDIKLMWKTLINVLSKNGAM